MKKYILTDDVIDFNVHTLHRIKAVRDFDYVKAGDLGGFIESEKNLDHDGDARVSGDAIVSDNADYTTVHGFGRYFRTTTFFRCNNGVVRCQCGCFYGTLEEFREKVKKNTWRQQVCKGVPCYC